MNKQWSDDLRQRMEQYETEAPEGLFDDIMKAMPATQRPTPQARIVPLWVRRTAVAAVVAIAVAAGYTLLDVEEPSSAEATLALSTPTAPAAIQSIPEAEPAPQTDATEPRALAYTAQRVNTEVETTPQPALATTPSNDDTATPNHNEQPATSVDKQPHAPKRTEASRPTSEPSAKRVFQATTAKRRNVGGLTASLRASGLSLGKSAYGTQSVFMVNSVLYGARADALDTPTDIVTHDSEQTISTDRHHHLPVRIGALLRYDITERWAIESGITYTKLVSEINIGNTANYYDERTALHYLGIPLNAVYNIYQSRRFAFYVSGGGMVEKSIAGSSRTDYFLDGKKVNSQRSDITVKELQWSVNAAVGAQFNLWPSVAIYAEPSVGYRFANGTKIETLYNERPLDFNMNIGLRFTLR